MPNFEVLSVHPVFNKKHANVQKNIHITHFIKPEGYEQGKAVRVHVIKAYDGVKE
jgi:hypothetical protein